MGDIINLIVDILGMNIANVGGVNITLGLMLAGYLVFEFGGEVFDMLVGRENFDIEKESRDHWYGRGDYSD